MVEFLILGPLEVRSAGATVAIGGVKQRLVLAMLLFRAGAFVPRESLIDGLWPDDPPASARHTLEAYVSRLRRALRSAGMEGDVIESGAAGYRLALDGHGVDRDAFDALTRDGHGAFAAGDMTAAAGRLRAALALWRGPALTELAAVRADAEGLEERRMHALETWADAELALGHHGELTARLRTEAALHQRRERLHELLMLALYRAGRQAEALEAFQTVRRHLADELGLEPGPALRELETRILQHDPALATRPPRAGRMRPHDAAAGQPFALPYAMKGSGRDDLVGRQPDLDRLGARYEQAAAGTRHVSLLYGEPGIGKSRLCAELALRAHAKGAVVLYGRCDEEPLLPHQPFVEALRQYVAACPSDELADQVRPVSGELRRILPELQERVPALSSPLPGDPDGARFRLFEAVSALLHEAAQRRPLVLVLDDLHWADQPTLLQLKHLARYPRQARMLVLGTHRETQTDPSRGVLADLDREPGVERHALTRLDPAAIARLVRRFGAGDSSAGFHQMIYERTDGNPFFVVEVMRHLAESSGVNHGQLSVPDSVKDVIARRLAHLDGETNRTLAIAAVLGRHFELAILERLSALDEDRLVEVLEGAVRARVVEEVDGALGRYSFSHALTRETVYSMLTGTRRSLLHRRAGAAIEAAHAADLEPYRAELAHHFSCAGTAGDLEQAIRHGAGAGDRAIALLAYEQGAAHYRRAVELLEEAGISGREVQRCDLVIAQGEAERQAGAPSYRDTLLKASRLAQQLHDAERLARAVLANSRGMFSSAQGIDRERVAVLHDALAAHQRDESATRAQLLALLAVELIAGAGSSERSRLADEALAMARRVGDPRTLALVLNQRFVTLWGPDTLLERHANARESGQLADRLGDPALVFYAAAFECHAAMEAGDLPHADRLLDRLGVLDRRLGQPIIHWYDAVSRAKRCFIDGAPRQAERLAGAAFEIGQAAGQPDAFAWYMAQTFLARFLRGSLDGGEPNLPQLFEIPGLSLPVAPGFTESRSVPLQMEAIKSVTFSELGRTDDARRHFEKLMAGRLEDLPQDYAALAIPALGAVACAHLRDIPRAIRLHAMLEPHSGQFIDAGPSWLGATPHHLALLAATIGRLDEADDRFATAALAYQSLGAQAWLARTRLEWAQTLLARRDSGDAERAGDLLGQATATAQELDLETLMRKATALQARWPA